ncbi:MAG: hypothetical protein M3O34_17215 [Chloroflexota bacterium]|nr:hypothetical protein [Chloroflexota bacterium]
MSLSTISVRLRELLSPISIGDAARYTAPDVRTLLEASTPVPASVGAAADVTAEAQDERRDAVLAVAARPSTWTSRLDRQQVWQLGRLADRLPTIVALYSRGTPIEEIARRERCLVTSTVERALDVACACIAAHLNASGSADDRLVARGWS